MWYSIENEYTNINYIYLSEFMSSNLKMVKNPLIYREVYGVTQHFTIDTCEAEIPSFIEDIILQM